ncbi:hypothetical protein C3454_12350 [Citrobacter europaeus]|nr:hypothetical protein MC47_009920 [Citrobacter freundii]ROW36337.1 hypothetical protein C3454_12350 [Citrobacter europaeus]
MPQQSTAYDQLPSVMQLPQAAFTGTIKKVRAPGARVVVKDGATAGSVFQDGWIKDGLVGV